MTCIVDIIFLTESKGISSILGREDFSVSSFSILNRCAKSNKAISVGSPYLSPLIEALESSIIPLVTNSNSSLWISTLSASMI